MPKAALGRGLGALLSEPAAPAKSPPSAPTAAAPATPADTRERVDRVPVAKIVPSPLQPRKQFSDESLKELADSIRQQGIVQPLIVRPRGDGYELIAGERRWRAAQ